MKLVVLLLTAFVMWTAAAIPAAAQPAAGSGSGAGVVRPPPQVRPNRQPTTVKIKDKDKDFVRVSPHGDKYESRPSSRSPGLALLFWAFALASIGGALFVISRRNLIAAVMGMVGSFIGISAIYMMLYANFIAVVQMLVYAGAIMVLFVFVIMILNRPEDEPVAPSGRAGQALGGLAILYLIFRLVMMLIHVQPPNPNAGDAPAQIVLPPVGGATVGEKVDWGSVKAVGMDLFGPGSFPFEAISILLLVAVVGAIAIARPMHGKSADDAEGTAP